MTLLAFDDAVEVKIRMPRVMYNALTDAVPTEGDDDALFAEVADHFLGCWQGIGGLAPNDIPSARMAKMIMESTADLYGYEVQALAGKDRQREVVEARQLAMFLIRRWTKFSLPRVGELFGGRDHTTVLHAQNKLKGAIERDHPIVNKLRAIETRLGLSGHATVAAV